MRLPGPTGEAVHADFMRYLLSFALVAGILLGCGSLWAEDGETKSGPGLDLDALAGEHTVRGRNADGSPYEGKVRIRVKSRLLLIEWAVNDQLSYGTGLVEGLTLGVALESGVAIYQIVPQAEGKSLIGLWAGEGAESASEETILIGDTDVSDAKFEVQPINGGYQALIGGVKGATNVEITGGDIVKRLALESGGQTAEAEGLALGDGLAVITPDGLSVFSLQPQGKKFLLTGHSVDEGGQVREVRLEPAK